jgi:glyoxylate reductase
VARCFVARILPGGALDELRSEHDVDLWEEDRPPPPEVLHERVAGCEGLLSMLTDRVDGDLLDSAPDLRAVSNYAVGVDNVDVAAATNRGIPVGHTPGVLTDSTADLAVALMLGIARGLVEGERVVRTGEWATWSPTWMLGRDLGDGRDRRRRPHRQRGGSPPRGLRL